MAKFKNKYRIISNRYRYWDYSSPGNYFITICINNRECILGDVVDGKMELSDYGKIVETELLKIPEYHKRILLDEWVIMPNHIHLIIHLGDYDFDNHVATTGGPVTADGADTVDTADGVDAVDGAGPVDGVDAVVDKIHEFYLPPGPPGPPRPPGPPGPPGPPASPQWWRDPQYKPTPEEINQYRKWRRNMIIPKILGKFQMLTSKQMNILRNTPGRKNWQRDYYDHIIRNEKSHLRIKKYIIKNPLNWKKDLLNDERLPED